MNIKNITSQLEVLILTLISFMPLACKKEKPNVVFILTDQWRASAFGYTGN
jgi:hypothetical protein